MGSKRDDIDGITAKGVIRSKGVTSKAGLPSEGEDVEGHKWKAKGLAPDEGLGSKSKGAVPEEEEDVEGHRFTAKGVVEGRPGGEFTNRKLPSDSPHGESYGRNKG